MAWTASDVTKLKQAIATGALQVRYADKTIVYRSLAEMKETLQMMQSEVNSATTTRLRTVRVNSVKGWNEP